MMTAQTFQGNASVTAMPNDLGWEFFKKGVLGQHGKNHYLKENWTSLCGMYKVGIDDQKFIHFVLKEQLRQRKICKACENYLKQRRQDIALGIEIT